MKPTNPAKITLRNIKKFIVGWTRYIFYKIAHADFMKKVSEDLKFLPKEKEEQFKWRLTIMDEECLKNGACKVCGCKTPQLQMADEGCEGGCYPDMMDKKSWNEFKSKHGIIV